jgi:hypothetical protein
LGIGDWGLGIGGLGQYPKPKTHNPKPPDPKLILKKILIIFKLNLKNK